MSTAVDPVPCLPHPRRRRQETDVGAATVPVPSRVRVGQRARRRSRAPALQPARGARRKRRSRRPRRGGGRSPMPSTLSAVSPRPIRPASQASCSPPGLAALQGRKRRDLGGLPTTRARARGASALEQLRGVALRAAEASIDLAPRTATRRVRLLADWIEERREVATDAERSWRRSSRTSRGMPRSRAPRVRKARRTGLLSGRLSRIARAAEPDEPDWLLEWPHRPRPGSPSSSRPPKSGKTQHGFAGLLERLRPRSPAARLLDVADGGASPDRAAGRSVQSDRLELRVTDRLRHADSGHVPPRAAHGPSDGSSGSPRPSTRASNGSSRPS